MADQNVSTEETDSLIEKPLSPVLSNNISRRLLLSRKLQRKSRVKLTDRFSEPPLNPTRTSSETVTCAAEETLASTATTSEINEKVEAETNDDQHKNISDFNFKKPESPLSSENFKGLQPIKKSASTGFRTAGGNSIRLSEDVIKTSKSLFDDILTPSTKICKRRANKYTFLSKGNIDSCVQNSSLCNKDEKIIENIVAPRKDINIFNIVPNQEISCAKSSCLGFKTASGKGLQIKESAYKIACKKFGEELGDYEPLLDTSEITKIKNDDINFLSTQETNELFSDFTTIEANLCKNNVTVKDEDQNNFKGFETELINQSRRTATEFKSVALEFSRALKFYSKSTKLLKLKASSSTTLALPCDSLHGQVQEFTTALGHKVHISNVALTKAHQSCKDVSVVCKDKEFTNKASVGFSMASGKTIQITESALNVARSKLLQELEDSQKESVQQKLYSSNLHSMRTQGKEDSWKASVGFSKASGEKIQITESALNTAKNKFLQVENSQNVPVQQGAYSLLRTQEKEASRKASIGFSKASGNKIHTTESALNIARTKFQREFEETVGSKFSEDSFKVTIAKNKFPIKGTYSIYEHDFKGFDDKTIEESRHKADIFTSFIQHLSSNDTTLRPNSSDRLPLHELGNETLKASCGFSTASGNKFIVSNKALEKAKNMYKDATSTSLDMKSDRNVENIKPNSFFQTATGTSLKISENAINQVKHLFDRDLSFDNSSTRATSLVQEETSFEKNNSNLGDKSTLNPSTKLRRKKTLGVSRCKSIAIAPHKIEQAMKLFENEESAATSPARQSFPTVYNSTPLKNSSWAGINTDITPIKSLNITISEKLQHKDGIDDRFLIKECSKGSIDSWNKSLDNEKRALEMKLKFIEDKQKALFFQKCCMESKSVDQKKKRNGILFDKKRTDGKVLLPQFLKVDSSFRRKLNIDPQNAELVHFRCPQQDVPFVNTMDGARIIPDANNYIGLSEIEIAFQVMPGVDPKLIPQGWVRNHFKWIVWKLASYENFSSNLKDCLTIENVVQQLKYRYDREIDRAERSALRKIYEMDDVPQKRMVLCVSNIFNLQNEQFELELTDGWYSIRSIIDKRLERQVIGRKIQIGTKLMTCGAELINCEGCHPLQATDMIRLKINCNSTRRTRWYTKLGYQKCSEPFPLKVCSIHPDGGVIGCIKIFIARVYPVKYMEKQNHLTVWRNRKAEELRAQDWENKERQSVENFRETITKDYEMNMYNSRKDQKCYVSDAEIKKITCPETLFTLCQSHNDPERLQEILTSSQKVSVMDYQQRLLAEKQREISRKLKDRIGKQEIKKRDVSAVLQVLVIDILDPNENFYVFQIWRPSDVHLEIMRESTVVNTYSVMPKRTGDLCSVKHTKFQPEHIDSSHFNKFQRTLLPISQLSELIERPLFNEFDTVGVVITMSINDFTQNLWLSDPSGRLLFIKIFENPKNCILLDKLKMGQLVAASNLIFCEPKLCFGEAIANHLTIFATYPQAKHLQEGINTLSDQLPKNMKLFLEECNQKVSRYVDTINITKDHRKTSTSLAQSNSSVSDFFDESSDVLFSMIDVDKYL